MKKLIILIVFMSLGVRSEEYLFHSLDYIESNDCESFLFDEFVANEMVAAGSYSKLCLSRYVSKFKKGLNFNEWRSMIYYLSRKGEYSLVADVHSNTKIEDFDPAKVRMDVLILCNRTLPSDSIPVDFLKFCESQK